jgi:hypothetical protein
MSFLNHFNETKNMENLSDMFLVFFFCNLVVVGFLWSGQVVLKVGNEEFNENVKKIN